MLEIIGTTIAATAVLVGFLWSGVAWLVGRAEQAAQAEQEPAMDGRDANPFWFPELDTRKRPEA